MKHNKFIGTFETQQEVLGKIEELKTQGIEENHMYAMAEHKNQLSLVRGQTDVDYKTSEGSWMDKFVGFMSGDDPTREAISRMGMDTRETDRYYHDVKNGKILLFVDEDLGDHYENENTAVYGSVRQDEQIGAGGGTPFDPTANLKSDPYLDNEEEVTPKDWQKTQTIDEDELSSFQSGKKWDDTVKQSEGTPTTGERRGMLDSASWDPSSHSDEKKIRHVSADDYPTNEKPKFNDEEERMQLHEERLKVDKERVQTGEVNVGKRVEEETQTLEVPIEREEVFVERRPVEREATGSDEAYQDGESIRIPLTEERVEVSKKDVVREEIVVGKRKIQDTETINETVRKEEADINENMNDADFQNKNL